MYFRNEDVKKFIFLDKAFQKFYSAGKWMVWAFDMLMVRLFLEKWIVT